jgi:hypothetical protein
MHEAPGKGGCSQSAINLRTSCAFLGLAHHHPPSGLAVLTPIIYNQGTTETDAHTSYPLCPFLHTLFTTPVHFRLPNTSFISPPH